MVLAVVYADVSHIGDLLVLRDVSILLSIVLNGYMAWF